MTRSLWTLLTRREKLLLFGVLGAMVVSGIVELAGIGSVVPFLAVAGDPELVARQPLLSFLYSISGLTDTLTFTVALGVAVIVFLVVSNVLKAGVLIITVRFGKDRMESWSVRLYRHILSQDYPYFLHKTSAEIMKYLWDDLPTVVTGVLVPWLNIAARLVVVVGVIALVLVADPSMALLLASVFGLSYLLLYLLIRRPLAQKGAESGALSQARYQHVLNSLGGIKDVKFLGLEADVLDWYEQQTRRQYNNDAARDTLATYPKYLLETVAFGAVVVIVLVYLKGGRSLTEVLPLLGLYALSGYRLMPYLQQIFTDFAKIRYSSTRLSAVAGAFAEGEPKAVLKTPPPSRMTLNEVFEVRNLNYRYPRSERRVLDNLSLSIRARTTVGLAGPSGSGKTTLVDVLLGLLPLDGEILFVDGHPVRPEALRSWSTLIGYVPQQIFLMEGTVAQNIAFGVPAHEIDLPRVREASERAQIHRLIEDELASGYSTLVGERGVRLSGGQRQRIGIARALYRRPEVLILDEATSSLDGAAETEVMAAIRSLGRDMTVLMVAHRLTTLRSCDQIFVLDKGTVAASGSYDSLLAENALFQSLARNQG